MQKIQIEKRERLTFLGPAFCLVLAIFCFTLPLKASDCYILAYDASTGPAVQPFRTFYEHLYQRAGLCARSIGMATKRAEQQVRTGIADGDWSRVEGYVDRANGLLVAVPQPVFEMAAYFMWLDSSGFAGTPQDLRDRLVGYHAGFRWIEWNLPKFEATSWALPNEENVFELLERRRMDVYATGAVNAIALSQSPQGKALPHKLALWREVPFYHVLHKSNEKIVPQLNAALTAMIASGEAAAILKVPGLKVAAVVK